MATNEHGLNVHYFQRELSQLLTSLPNRTPQELARALARLSKVAAGAEDFAEAGKSITPAPDVQHQLEMLREGECLDAERYRWLRDVAQYLDNVPICLIPRSDGHAQEILSEDELDEAVDAAREAHGEQS